MIRDHHQVIPPGTRDGEPLEGSKHAVDAVERVKGFGAKHPGMVRDLVIVHVVDVDAARSLAHLLGKDGGVQVAHQYVRDRPEDGEGPSAVDPWCQVVTDLAASLEALLADLGEHTHQPSHETLRIGHEAGDGLPRVHRPASDPDLAHRQQGPWGIPGEEVGH